MKALFDTNILIDYLNGIAPAAEELRWYEEKAISIISYIEVLVGAESGDEEDTLRSFLEAFHLVALDHEVANRAVVLRRDFRLKLPDAVVYASAQREGCLLVTRNTKDFNPSWPDVREPYKI